MNLSDTVLLPKGFQFSAATAGIKASGKPDLGLILAGPSSRGAALFTKNRIVAAPVEVGRSFLARNAGRLHAVIVNSGNANCATGVQGIRDCRKVCEEMAELLKVQSSQIFPSSTGIIGVPLPTERITSNLNTLLASAGSSIEHIKAFANAIITTDTRPKIASRALKSGAVITGIAKGSGMIHPQLATMLVYVVTDTAATPAELRAALKQACDESFNVISVDGDTSTNDTVLVLASGESKVQLNKVRKEFQVALGDVCRSLAEQIVRDGEGVQHVIRLRISEAKSRAEALQIARAISSSLLVKTAWAGADPNWGRILAAAGRSGVAIDPKKVSVTIGDQVVCKGSVACGFDEKRAHEHLAQTESTVGVRLGRGKLSLDFLTTDLTAEYVHINADYST